MNDNFRNLLEQLDLQDKTTIYQGDLIEIVVDDAQHGWLFRVEFNHPLAIEDFEVFHHRITKLPEKFPSITKAELNVSYKSNDFAALEEYYSYVLHKLAIQKPRFNAIIEFDIEQKGNRIEVVCPKDGTFVTDMLYEVKSELLMMGFDVFLATRICKELFAVAN